MSIPLKLYNTESRKKEILKPLENNHIKMYTCGPTVYDYAHIGNFRTYVFEDILRRTIKFFGMKITQAMNITDVDDKTIRGAISKNVALNEYTRPFKEAFFEDLKTLNIESAEFYPAATDYIPEMIEMVKTLLDKGIAYEGGDGSIYFAIQKFPRYGCLSHLNLDDLKAGASERVAHDEYEKENVADFVIWKKYDSERDGNIFWESPFGPGRPGWHLECSAMAIHLLGKEIDIHAGGIDNMFPHHENEIAQSEACTGHHFVKIWMHAEHLIVDNKKMSKRLGNFYTLRDLLEKGYSGMQIRYLLFLTHYKTQLNFTFIGLDSGKNSLQRLQDFIFRLQEIDKEKSSGKVQPILEQTLQQFSEEMADNLNTSGALAVVFEMVRQINTLCDELNVSKTEAEASLALLQKLNQILGFLTFEKDEKIPQEVQQAFENRMTARQEKNWKKSDELRDYILSKGYVIEDTLNGARLKKQ